MRCLVRLAAGAALMLVVQMPSPTLFAQDSAAPSTSEEVTVLDDALERWVTSAYRAAALCYETIGQLINEHAVFTDPNRLANAQKLRDALGGLIDASRNEMFARGLSFEQSQAIDSYFYQFTQPKTARYVATQQADALAIDLRSCPAAVQRLQLQLKEITQ